MTNEDMKLRLQRADFVNQALKAFDERQGKPSVLRTQRATHVHTAPEPEATLAGLHANADARVAQPPVAPNILLSAEQVSRAAADEIDIANRRARAAVRNLMLNDFVAKNCTPIAPILLPRVN